MMAMMLAVLAGACDRHPIQNRVAGDSPLEVAAALARIQGTLDPERSEEFAWAIRTLMLVVPDKHDERAAGAFTPEFIRLVHGRDAAQIVQLADLYRAAAPADRRRRTAR